MIYIRIFAVLMAALTFGASTKAQEISPETLCDAGIGDLVGGVGRLACKAITTERLTADDVVEALSEQGTGVPVPPTYSDPYASMGGVASSQSPLVSSDDPCADPDTLECEYQRILDDLDTRYGGFSEEGVQ